MDVDAIIEEVGSFGKYQKLLLALLCFPVTFALPYTFMGQLFQTTIPTHWCHVPELMGLSVNDRKTMAIPIEETDEGYAFNKCYMYNRNYTELLIRIGNISNGSLNRNIISDFVIKNHNDSLIRCSNGWEYDFQSFRPTASSDYNWVCDEDWKPYVSLAIFFIGSCCGAVLFGYISDTYGRAPTVLIANAVAGLANLATAFSQEFISFSIMRFFAGLTFDLSQISFYILVMEYVHPNRRTAFSNLSFGIFFTAGSVILPWLAYTVPNWRYFCGICAIPFLLILPFYRYIPESARWLIVRNRIDDAVKQLKVIAKVNNKQVKEETWEEAKVYLLEAAKQEKPKKKYTYLDLLKKPKLRLRTVMITLLWFIVMLSYDGLVRNTENLGWDIFLSSTVGNATELPAAIIPLLLLDKIGRRLTSIGGFVLAAAFSFSVLLVPPGMTWLFVTLAVAARLMVTAMMNIFMQYKAELFPTVVRGQGMSFAHLVGFIGSMSSPFIVYLGHYCRVYPLIIFGTLTAVGAVITVFLPETLYENLPENLEDGEKFGVDQSFFYFPRRSPKNKTTIDRVAAEIQTTTTL
ncbi:hypothetical protein CHUAL_010360 [Chamberlinius hualienensis]